ncbi:helix-turn-helix transcriptional regulator [Ponticoccus litoralis]|uniref:Autoinducer binding domain-containing protein n=1 Tax=Ponticoccus litoralis TaxID=422297 RepID=A0AAW9SLR9_9RHOB
MKAPEGNQPQGAAPRGAFGAESFFPPRMQKFLRRLEQTTHSDEVWALLKALGQDVGLPCIDFIAATDYGDWRRTMFVRTSYDASWLHDANTDPDLYRWSYFRSHGIACLTPIVVGLEFLREYRTLPDGRIKVLREAARRGMRAGISIPLRQHAPRQAAMMSFLGDHDRGALLDILAAEGWTLTHCAQAAHQRYLLHFTQEYVERNRITDKQLELMELIGRGYLDKHIADHLEISVSAVRQRLNALMQKTGTTNRVELAALAMSIGMLPDPLYSPGSAPAVLVQSGDSEDIRTQEYGPEP